MHVSRMYHGKSMRMRMRMRMWRRRGSVRVRVRRWLLAIQNGLDLILMVPTRQQAVAHLPAEFPLGLFFFFFGLGCLLGLFPLPLLHGGLLKGLALLALLFGLFLLHELLELDFPAEALFLGLFFFGFVDCKQTRVSDARRKGSLIGEDEKRNGGKHTLV